MPSVAEFELRVLLAVRGRAGDAYAVGVHAEVERLTGRKASLGAVYVTLDRLERKRLLASRLGEPTAERGGRAKRYYRLTRLGQSVVRDECRIMRRLLDGFGTVGEK